jgi:hypothetical protein
MDIKETGWTDAPESIQLETSTSVGLCEHSDEFLIPQDADNNLASRGTT